MRLMIHTRVMRQMRQVIHKHIYRQKIVLDSTSTFTIETYMPHAGLHLTASKQCSKGKLTVAVYLGKKFSLSS